MPKLGLQNSLTSSGAPTKLDRWSLAFDGGDDYVDCGTSATLRTAAFSVAVWVKFPSAAIGTAHGIVSSARSDTDLGLSITKKSNNKCEFRIGNGSTLQSSYTDTAMVADTWYHLVFTYDGDETNVYQDTALEDTDSYADYSVSDVRFAIGLYYGNNTDSNLLLGSISDVAYYNTALSQSQVTTIYNNRNGYNHRTGTASANLAGWWRMGDGESDKGSDSDGANFVGDGTSSTALGPELITDPSFDDDSEWSTIGSGWTVNTGTPGKAVGSSTTASINKNSILTVGQVYKVTFTISDYTSGNVRVLCGSANGTVRAATGTFTDYLRANTIHFSIDAYSAFTGALSDISVKAIGSINGGLMVSMDAADFEQDTP
jgi:hypothetical protein